MSEKRGRGQPKFEPTPDQRSQGKLMKAIAIPEDRAFAAELESGATEVHALVGNFIICAILGKRPALGDAIKSEQVRMTAAGLRRIALVGPTVADARNVMVEGESGILAISPNPERLLHEPSKRRLTWPNGAVATTYSADEPERLRGPQHDAAWCDELAAWRYPEAWDMLMFCGRGRPAYRGNDDAAARERRRGRLPNNFVQAEWITLHDNSNFRGFVDFLRAELDRVGPAEADLCRDFFCRAVALKPSFVEAAHTT